MCKWLCNSALHGSCSIAPSTIHVWSLVKASHPEHTGLCSEGSQSQGFTLVRHICVARPDLGHHQVLIRFCDRPTSLQSRFYGSSSPAASRAGEVSTWRRWLVCHCSLTCCSSSFSSCSCFSFSRASQNLALLLLLLGSPRAGLPSPCGLRSGQSVSSTASSSSPAVEGIYHLQMAVLHAEGCAVQQLASKVQDRSAAESLSMMATATAIAARGSLLWADRQQTYHSSRMGHNACTVDTSTKQICSPSSPWALLSS